MCPESRGGAMPSSPRAARPRSVRSTELRPRPAPARCRDAPRPTELARAASHQAHSFSDRRAGPAGSRSGGAALRPAAAPVSTRHRGPVRSAARADAANACPAPRSMLPMGIQYRGGNSHAINAEIGSFASRRRSSEVSIASPSTTLRRIGVAAEPFTLQETFVQCTHVAASRLRFDGPEPACRGCGPRRQCEREPTAIFSRTS